MPAQKTHYYEAVGRRKTAVARVRITQTQKRTIEINERAMEIYFPARELRSVVLSALEVPETTTPFAVSVIVRGGGSSAQAEAIRLGIARALVSHNELLRKPLKSAGLLRRDARTKERKKFGLRKARRAPQWSKR